MRLSCYFPAAHLPPCGCFCLTPARAAADLVAADFTRIQNVVYWRQQGQDLTLDVFKPAHANRSGLAWMISGGWVSSTNFISSVVPTPFLQHGYTVFAVTHTARSRIQGGGHHAEHSTRDSLHPVSRGRLRNRRKPPGHHGAAVPVRAPFTDHCHPGWTRQPGGRHDPVDRESSTVECAAYLFFHQPTS